MNEDGNGAYTVHCIKNAFDVLSLKTTTETKACLFSFFAVAVAMAFAMQFS